MKYIVLRECIINICHTYYCGDGCCTGTDSNPESFKLGDELVVDQVNALYHILDIDSFPYRNDYPYNEEDSCPRIYNSEMTQLIDEGSIELFELY